MKRTTWAVTQLARCARMRLAGPMVKPPYALGATIEESLEDFGMSRAELAREMNVTEERVRLLIEGKIPLTPEMANTLELAFGPPADFWLRLYAVCAEKCGRCSR